jgi:hypothetical protein
MEDTIQKEIQKLKKVMEILNFSEKEINEQLNELEFLLRFNVILEVLKRKGYHVEHEFDFEKVEKFLREKCLPEEIKEIGKEIATNFLTDYLNAITKNTPKEKKEKIEEILGS